MKFNLNLSEYQPYKTMGRSCQLKDIMEYHICWPELVTASTLTNSDLNMRYMRGNDINKVVELWKDVYPEAYGSTHQFVFDSQWYEDNVLFDEKWKTDKKEKNMRLSFWKISRIVNLSGCY